MISRLNQLREVTPAERTLAELPVETAANNGSDRLHAGMSEEMGERDIDGNNNNDDDIADSIEYNLSKNHIQRVSLPRPAVEEVNIKEERRRS